MKQGMTMATEFVITGGSAGGLPTVTHADRVAARLKKEAPKCEKIRAAPTVGYFLDHDNFAHNSASAKPCALVLLFVRAVLVAKLRKGGAAQRTT